MKHIGSEKIGISRREKENWEGQGRLPGGGSA